MDPLGSRINQLAEFIGISVLELNQLALFQQKWDHLVVVFELGQHTRIGASLGLAFFQTRQSQPVKKNLGELFG